jgi:hypothetical protein
MVCTDKKIYETLNNLIHKRLTKKYDCVVSSKIVMVNETWDLTGLPERFIQIKITTSTFKMINYFTALRTEIQNDVDDMIRHCGFNLSDDKILYLYLTFDNSKKEWFKKLIKKIL